MIEEPYTHIDRILQDMSDKELSEMLQLCGTCIDPIGFLPEEILKQYPGILQLILCTPNAQEGISHVTKLLEKEAIHRWLQENP